MKDLAGELISHYRIIEAVGQGGMGVVYKAEDTKLKRTVALKFLPPELTRDAEAKERLIHEAQAASSLQHNNICAVHDIDETPEGQLFIVMDFYEGETLKERIRRGPLKIDDAIDIAIRVAGGLVKAHQNGIIHRDIKPANVMITTDGVAKILDFGLAKLSGRSMLTRTGSTLGTAAYMSPEQARGDPADRRTDIWSLGVVTYEMVTGRLPFKGDYDHAVLYSILNTQPEPMTGLRTGVPPELERIVNKSLAKDPSERYQHVEDMLVDLRSLRSDSQAPGPLHGAKRVWTRGRVITAGVAAALLIVAASTVLYRLLTPSSLHHAGRTSEGRTMVVVLPFENVGAPEDEYFANGTTDAIIARLASITRLGVISRQSAMQYKKTTKTIRQIGDELSVDYVLEGTVQRERPGDPRSRVRVIPELVRVADDTHVWADTYDENMVDVFRVQSAIAERVATQLNLALLEPERRAIEKKPTENLAAYESYLRGMDLVDITSITDLDAAVAQLKRAVALDPRFAEAWAGLTLAYHSLFWLFDRPGTLTLEKDAARRAEELAPDLPETHLALGYVAYAQRQFDRALEHFQKAEHFRSSGEAAQAICRTFRRLGRWQEALDAAEKARRLLPRSHTIYEDELGYTKMAMRRYDEAAQDFDQATSLFPRLNDAYLQKAYLLAAKGGDAGAGRPIMLEMCRRSLSVESAEATMTQGFEGPFNSITLRLFPETFSAVLDTFEAGTMAQYRGKQPAVIATAHLARAIIYERMGNRQAASARYDSARACYEKIIRSNPQSAYICMYHSDLGLAYAGLGHCKEAIREGEEGAGLVPLSRDAIVGADRLLDLAEIEVRCGEHEAAINQLETLLSVPSQISPGLLRADPLWDPLRSNPRFQRLVEQK
jgi:serine/threonine protein kinase/tetratricopeptide (TPR) repeat protein